MNYLNETYLTMKKDVRYYDVFFFELQAFNSNLIENIHVKFTFRNKEIKRLFEQFQQNLISM